MMGFHLEFDGLLHIKEVAYRPIQVLLHRAVSHCEIKLFKIERGKNYPTPGG